MRNELLPYWHITVDVDFEQEWDVHVTKKAMLYVEADDSKMDRFLAILRKDVTGGEFRNGTVTVSISPDHHRSNDICQHRYIPREYGTVGYDDGYEKRPFTADKWSGGSFPEVPVVVTERGKTRLAMFKAIKQEITELLHSERDRLKCVAAYQEMHLLKSGLYYLWNTRTLTAGAETYLTQEEASTARRAMKDSEADETYVKCYNEF